MYKFGAEEIKFSSDQSYVYSANGSSGLLIIDIRTQGKLKLVSQVILEGWAQSVVLLWDPNYIVIGHGEKG